MCIAPELHLIPISQLLDCFGEVGDPLFVVLEDEYGFHSSRNFNLLDKGIMRLARTGIDSLLQQGMSIQARVLGVIARNFSIAIESCWYESVSAICFR